MQNEKNKKLLVLLSPAGLSFLIPFLMYVWTAAHTVTFEDSGLFILSGFYWGLPHPPGYPLYTMLAHVFSMLPFDTVAFRVGLLSVILGSLSSWLMYRIFNRISLSKWAALFAALVVAFASVVWGQMIIAEVYALNLFLSLLFLELCMQISEKNNTKNNTDEKSFFWLGFVGAMALSNHWPIFVLSGPTFLFYIKKQWFTKKKVLAFLSGLVFVLLPYLIMWWRSLQNPEVSFLGEIRTADEWFKYIARNYYSATDASVLYSWRDTFGFYKNFIERLFYRDFIFILTPLFFLGVWYAYKCRVRQQFYSFLYLMCTTSFILPFLLKLEFNALDENVYSVFWLLPYFAYGYFVLNGALWVESRFSKLGCIVLALGVSGNIISNYKENNLRTDRFAEDYARVVLKNTPSHAALVASTDSDVGPIAYVNLVLKENPTVRLYTGSGVFFKDRIFDPLSRGLEKRYKLAAAFVQMNSPVYSVKNINIFEGRKNLPFYSVFNGVIYKYSTLYEVQDPVSDEIVEMSKKALDNYVSTLGTSNWPYHRGTLAARLCNILVLKGVETHEVFERAPLCQQVLARHLAATGRREKADEFFMKWLRNYKNAIVSERQQYVYHFLINRLEIINAVKRDPEFQKKLIDEMLPIAESTLFEYPLCDNMVYTVLNSIKNQIKLSPEAISQMAVFSECSKK